MTHSRYTISPIYKFCSLDEPSSPFPGWEANYDPAACYTCWWQFVTCRNAKKACEDYNLVFEQIVIEALERCHWDSSGSV